MIGRPLEFDRDTALDAAMRTFCRQGYEATSLLDLLAAMGLSKSSLYQSFGDKQALYHACLERYCGQFMQALEEALASQATAMAALEQVLMAVAEEAADPAPLGCLLHNSINEFGRRDPAMTAAVQDRITRLRATLIKAIKRAQRERGIDPARSPQDLADFLIAGISGLRSMVKAGLTVKQTRGIARHLLASL